MPIEPAVTRWVFPDPAHAGSDDVVAIGADLEPGTLLTAYRAGLFPMYLPDGGPLAWWSPVRRGVLPVDGMRVTRSLRRSIGRFEWSVDEAFGDVVAGCADPARPHGWITPDITDAYEELHRLGHAHSIEVWESGRLAGGLYGVNIGGLFAGESMFHRVADASKVALFRLVEIMATTSHPLVDTQWQTDHLASLGGIEIDRQDYLSRLSAAIRSPIPRQLAGR